MSLYFLIPVVLVGGYVMFERYRIHNKYVQQLLEDCDEVLGSREETIKCAKRWLKEHEKN